MDLIKKTGKINFKELSKQIGLAILMFYIVYPQALSVMGSSCLLALGAAGLIAYVYYKFPFRKEMFLVILVFAVLYFIAFNSANINGTYDTFIGTMTNSQMGWLFAAFLFNLLFFKVHKKPSFNLLLRYIVLAIFIQSVLTTIMYFNKEVNDFLYSIQLQTEMSDADRARFETERLMGYGTGLFGAGVISGYGLIVMAFLICREKLNSIQLALAAGVYCFIFYIGLFSARTALIGFGMSLLLICLLVLFDNSTQKKQSIQLGGFIIVFTGIGMTLAYFYFPEYSDWAFEALYNYQDTGLLYTKSSSGLIFMFFWPEDSHTFWFGRGSFRFFGTDVGYTRLAFYIGIPGMIMYFLYSLNLIRLSLTKDIIINFFFIYLFIYVLSMNIKGFTDVNVLFCLFFFFFLFYKDKILKPKSLEYNKAIVAQRRAKWKNWT